MALDLKVDMVSSEVAAAIDALEEQTFRKGDVIFQQDSQGDACFFVIMGECHATAQVYTLEKGTRVTHKKHGVGQVVEVTHDPSITKVQFAGESHRYVPASLHKLKPTALDSAGSLNSIGTTG